MMGTSPESRLVLCGFGLSLLILAGIGAVTYQTNHDVLDADESRARSLEVVHALESVLFGLSDAESEQRAFIITGEASHLDEMRRRITAVRHTVVSLAALASNNTAQARRVTRLLPLIEERVAALNRGIRARESGGFASAQALVARGEGSRWMDEIQTMVEAMKQDEMRLIETQEDALEARGDAATRVTLGGALATMLIVSLVFVLLRRQVTERRRGAESLRHQTLLLRSIVDSMADGLVVADREGRVALSNEAAAGILGAAVAEAGAGAWAEACGAFLPDRTTPFPPDQLPLARAVRGEPSDDVDMYVRNPSRPEGAFVSATGRPLREAGGAGGGVVVLHDVTAERRSRDEMRHAREAAEAASRTKSEFVANVSHEIRTPLNGVLGMLDLALETQLDETQTRYLTTAHAAARSLVELISDLLDFARIEAGKLVVDAADFRLREMLGDTLAQFGAQIQSKRLEMDCEVDADVPDAVCGDPGRLRQILVNLVGNAIKFTDRGGIVVHVQRETAEAGGIRLRFTVTDTGIGIPVERQAQVFDPFTQADGSTTRRFGGTGLGLTICARLARLMGGNIALTSRPGHGTTVRLSLPFAPAATTGHEGVVGDIDDLRGLAILLVGDSRLQRTIVGDLLEAGGMRPLAVAEGAEALTALRDRKAPGSPFAAAIIDTHLTDMDGFHLVERLREDAATAALPVIMTTAAGQRGDAARCRALGIAAYLTRPVRQTALHSALLAALSLRPGQVERSGPLTRHTLRASRRKLDILLVEDNEFNLAYMVEVLRKQGYVATVARDGYAAVEACARRPFDLVLMDVQMPGMDGLQATTAIREQERGRNRRVPIIALTARAMKDDRQRCLDAGMDGYLPKPIRARDLFDAIDAAIDPDTESPAETADADGHAETAVAGGAGGAESTGATGSTGNMGGADAIDPAAILAEVDGDRDLLRRMVGLFRESADGHMMSIRKAVLGGDARELGEAAHALKGMIGFWCRGRAFKAAEGLEHDARRGELGAAAGYCATLERELPRLGDQLGRLLSEARVA
jgi:signal transduction histidine kinase/DNA-binding response OmpR family regulator